MSAAENLITGAVVQTFPQTINKSTHEVGRGEQESNSGFRLVDPQITFKMEQRSDQKLAID